MAPTIHIEISPGELIDRLTILELKLQRIGDPVKVANVRREFEAASAALANIPQDAEIARLRQQLRAANAELWDVEDALRAHEKSGDFGERFVALARSVYRTNDRRAALKRAINDQLGSSLTEEKSYSSY